MMARLYVSVFGGTTIIVNSVRRFIQKVSLLHNKVARNVFAAFTHTLAYLYWVPLLPTTMWEYII